MQKFKMYFFYTYFLEIYVQDFISLPLRYNLNLVNFIKIISFMKDILFDNADSFAIAFDDEWQKIKCQDLEHKIDQVIDSLSKHPYLISNPNNARSIAEFRVYKLKKFQ